MPIPVAVGAVPLPINDTINAAAEAALVAFVQLVARGTSGSAITTPPITVDQQNTGTVTPVLLASPADQLFVRHTMLAISAAVSPIVGTGSVPLLATSVVISNARCLAATSKVFITATGPNVFWDAATGWYVTVVDGSFTLSSGNAATGTAANFQWMLVP